MTNDSLRRRVVSGVWTAIALGGCAPAAAQVGDISGVDYPGWSPADGVEPLITEGVSHDGATGLWNYSFELANDFSASQDIEGFDLRFSAPEAPGSIVAAPAGWSGAVYSAPRAAIPGVSYLADGPNTIGAARQPAPAQIPPSQSLTGYTMTSPYPPGYARAYVKGFVPLPYISEDDVPDPIFVPDDTTNSQRRWTIGPTRYTEVVTGGNRRPATDGFLGFMNLAAKGSVLIDPAPIALKFSLNGETVFTNTLSIKLNGVDVTDQFHPGPSDGADLVGLFFLGSSPLQVGKNVLLTEVDGVVPGTTHTGKDSDRITFTVDPNLDPSHTTNSLENLPFSG